MGEGKEEKGERRKIKLVKYLVKAGFGFSVVSVAGLVLLLLIGPLRFLLSSPFQIPFLFFHVPRDSPSLL